MSSGEPEEALNQGEEDDVYARLIAQGKIKPGTQRWRELGIPMSMPGPPSEQVLDELREERH